MEIYFLSKNGLNNLKRSNMAWVLVMSHIGFALWFYVGYQIGKRK